MSLAQLTLDDVLQAERDVLDLHAVRLTYIYGDAAVERMVNLPENGMEAFRFGRRKPVDASDSLPRPIYDPGYCHAANAYQYAWLGTLPAGLHSCDLATDMETIAQFLKSSPALETHDSEDFTYANFRDLPSDQILMALASAVYARFAIEDGYDIPLEGVAALARVSDKTIRTAANPRLPGALRTIKTGNRTYVKAEDALDWLLRRPDFRPTEPRTEFPEEYRGDASRLAAFLVDRRRRFQADDFANSLKKARFPEKTWTALENDLLDPAAPGIDGVSLLALGNAMAIQSPRAFALWVLELALNARKTSAELAHHAELVRLNQAITSA